MSVLPTYRSTSSTGSCASYVSAYNPDHMCHSATATSPHTLPDPASTATPTVIVPAITSSTNSEPSSEQEPWVRPRIGKTLKAHSRPVVLVAGLGCLLAGLITGWAMFMTKQNTIDLGGSNKGNSDDGSNSDGEDDNSELSPAILVIDALFIIAVIAAMALFIRQIFSIHHLFQPPSPPPAATPTASSFLPAWLLPPRHGLPTYIDAIGGRQQIMGDVEGRYIVSGSLPRYGNDRGSKLLLRSESRGGDMEEGSPTTAVRQAQADEQGHRDAEREGPVRYEVSQVEARSPITQLSHDQEPIQGARMQGIVAGQIREKDCVAREKSQLTRDV